MLESVLSSFAESVPHASAILSSQSIDVDLNLAIVETGHSLRSIGHHHKSSFYINTAKIKHLPST
jgi:hypothetical protein